MENLNILLSRIPIINYHKIETTRDIGITTRTPKQFTDDMHFLYDYNYHTITFKNLLDGTKIPENPIIITFDDAYRSFYTSAFPLLKKLHFSAVIYVPLDYLGRWNDWDVQYYGKRYKHVSKDELLEIHNSGMEIGSHTLSHRMLTTLDKNDTEKEIKGSKEQLENLLNAKVNSISYPFSRFNDNILELTDKAGYSFGVASLYYRKLNEKYHPLSLKRFNIYRIDGSKSFQRKVMNKNAKTLVLRDWLIQKGGIATSIHQLAINRRRND